MSGSTMNGLLIVNDTLYCANLGDSRTILCSKIKGEWIAESLSID